MADAFSSPFLAGASILIILRWLLVIVASYNLYKGFPGIPNLFRGMNWPLSVYRAGMAFFSAGTVLLQLLVLIGADRGVETSAGIAGLALLLGGHVCYAYVHLSGIDRAIARFYRFYPRIEQAEAIVQLDSLDPCKAAALHRQTKTAIAIELRKRADGLDRESTRD